MIKFLVVGLLIYIGYRIIVAMFSNKKTPEASSKRHDQGVETHRDPVCGVYLSDETAIIGRHGGQRHYFCSLDCLEKYREQLNHSSPS